MNTRAVHFPLMDSIRAIALLAVVAAHTAFFIAASGENSLTRIRFDFSVRVFFMISAFLLYRPFVRARLNGERAPYVRAYAWHRFLRIVPAYWVALTLIGVLLALPGVFTLTGVPLYYGMAQIYTAETAVGGLQQAWSLCVEIVFYAMLPLIAALMRRLRASDRRRALLHELVLAAVLFALAIAFKVLIVDIGTLREPDLFRLQTWFPAFLDDFGVGMALAALSAYYENRPRLPRPLRLLDRFPALPWAVGLLALWIVSARLGLTGNLFEQVSGERYLARHYLYMVVAVGLVLPAMFGDPARGLVRRILANRVLLYLGMISYGVYLWHIAVLLQLRNWGFEEFAADTNSYVWYPVALAGSVLVATLSYYGLERPALRLKRLVGRRPQPQPLEATAEPAPAAPPRVTPTG